MKSPVTIKRFRTMGNGALKPRKRRFGPFSPTYRSSHDWCDMRAVSSLLLVVPARFRLVLPAKAGPTTTKILKVGNDGRSLSSLPALWGRDERSSSFLSLPLLWGGWHIVSSANDVTGGGLFRPCASDPHPTGLRPATHPASGRDKKERQFHFEFQTASQSPTPPRSRRVIRASLHHVKPSEIQRAWGMPGARCTRSLACKK